MEGYQQQHDFDDHHSPQPSAPVIPPQGYSGDSGVSWIEPGDQNAIIAALLGLLGFLPIPLIGFGHLYIGQKGKFFYFLTMGLATLLFNVLAPIPVVNLFAFLLSMVLKIALTVIAIVDAYTIGDRLQQGKPVAAGECSFMVLPLADKFVNEPVFVSDSLDSPPEYRARVGPVAV